MTGSPSPALPAEWNATDPESEALVFEGRVWSYRMLAEAASQQAAMLARLGVRPGDRVAIWAPPTPQGVFLIHGMLERGIVIVPLNFRLAPTERVAALELAEARFLVLGRSDGVDGLADEEARRLAETTGCGLLRMDGERLLLVRPPVEPDAARLGEARRAMRSLGAALILLTSGTSGRPKAALLSFANLESSARASIELLGHRPGDRWLLCMPLFHIGGLSILIRSRMAGTSVVLHRRFEAREVARALEEERISQVSFVATMLARVLEARGRKRSPAPLRLVLLGGGPAPESLLRNAVDLGYPIAPTYGLTEAASQVATRPPVDPRARAFGDDSFAGADLAGGLTPLPGVEIRLVDASGKVLGAGLEGEIEVRGPNVMIGYLGDVDATAEALRDGWLRTGDVGRLDEQGGLRVLDRRSDLILSGGENIYPAEIESVLTSHPNVLEAGVVGREDPEYGARPIAFVVERTPGTPDLDAFCRARLAAFKVPVEFRSVEALPRTASGKLLRRSLLDRSLEFERR